MTIRQPALQRAATDPVIGTNPKDREVAALDHTVHGRAVDPQYLPNLNERQDLIAAFFLFHRRRDFWRQ